MRPDKNVLATTQLLGGTAPPHHHQSSHLHIIHSHHHHSHSPIDPRSCKFGKNTIGPKSDWMPKSATDGKYGAVPVVLARRAALPAQTKRPPQNPQNFPANENFAPFHFKTYPFCSWNFLSSRTKFSCSWRYTAGSLFNIFAILRLCHFHITFTAFSGETKAICVSRGFGGPLLHLMKGSAA